MIKDNVTLVVNGPIDTDDFLFVLGELSGKCRKKIFDDMLNNGLQINDGLILEYFQMEGEDEILLELMNRFNGEYSKETIGEFIESGCDPQTLNLLLKNYNGKFTFDDVVGMLEFFEFDNKNTRYILMNTVGYPTRDQIEEILDTVDESLYPLMKPYVAKLPFSDRIEIKDMYDI